MTRRSFEVFAAEIRARKARLRAAGVRLPSDEEMRNTGRRRTTEKRALLERADERAKAAGREPVDQSY